MKLLPIICFLSMLSGCYGSRLLGIFAFSAKSHFVMFERMMKALAEKGHQVDVISTFPLKKPYPNYKDLIVIPTKRQFVNNMTFHEVITSMRSSVTSVVSNLGGNVVCENLADPAIQKLVRDPPKNPPYDLVIIEWSSFGSKSRAVHHSPLTKRHYVWPATWPNPYRDMPHHDFGSSATHAVPLTTVIGLPITDP